MNTTMTLTPPTACATSRTRQVNIRFDELTRSALERVAADQDRTLTQLVGYAVTWWITQPVTTSRCAVQSPRARALDGRQVNVRLPLALLGQLDRHAGNTLGPDRSNAIRAAVRTWLPTTGHPPSAGAPL